MEDSFMTAELDPQTPQEQVLQVLRLIGASLGLLLVIAGVCLSFSLFKQITTWVHEPLQFKPHLDRWEEVLRGSASSAHELKNAIAQLPQAQSPVSESPVKINLDITRPSAAGLMAFCGLILVSLLVGLINAGVRLLAITTPDRAMIWRVIRQVNKYGGVQLKDRLERPKT